MRYIHVSWLHEIPGEPIDLYSELDDGAWEVRKVEAFRGGRADFADPLESSGATRLGEEPVPPPEVIALDPQFRAEEISRVEFERVWDLARSSADERSRGDEAIRQESR